MLQHDARNKKKNEHSERGFKQNQPQSKMKSEAEARKSVSSDSNGGGSGKDEELFFLKSPQTECAYCAHTSTLHPQTRLGWRRRVREEQKPEVS